MSYIKPEYYSLNELLQFKFFEIPNYQRTYSWTKKQREDLFNDINKIPNWRDKERHHFMSTIVCLHRPGESKRIGTDRYDKYYVVDGQQRITTLIIVLKALSKAMKAGTPEEKEESKKIAFLLVKDDKRLILLQTNHDNHQIFFNYLENGEIPKRKTAKTVTDRNMIDAFNECEEFVKKWKSNLGLINLLSIVKNRMGFIFYVLKDSGSVYTVFEVLNSRGLLVDWLDKAKSMLMGIIYDKFPKHVAHEHIDHLHKTWTEIYRKIGLTDIPGHEIVRFSATLMNENSGDKPLSPEESLGYFSSLCVKNREKVFEIVNFISKVTDKLKELYSNRRQKAVTDISQARLLAIAIKLSKYNDSEKERLLEFWERISFRIFGIFRNDSRTAVGAYVRLSKKIMNKKSRFSEVLYDLKEMGKKYPTKQFTEMLAERNCYDYWEEEARYFFFRYEEYLTKSKRGSINDEAWMQIWNDSPVKSIEHIFPQNPNEHWRGKLGRGQNVITKHKNRLGNLAILTPPSNSACRNYGFIKKKKVYKESAIRLLAEIANKNDWNLKTIKERERRLIRWAKDTWGD